jgi:hypothetical protein
MAAPTPRAFTGTRSAINASLNGMTFTPPGNVNGAASLRIQTSDQGHTGSGGALTDDDTLSVTVNAVNDVPSFTKGADQTVNEDAGAQTVTGWATAISAGPSNESAQTLTFNVTGNTNAALFAVAPAISSTGELTYTPADDAYGTATVTITSATTAARPTAASTPRLHSPCHRQHVNDAPSFTAGGDKPLGEDGARRLGRRAGPPMSRDKPHLHGHQRQQCAQCSPP